MRAKTINEFGGAGFSYGGASMASARPGGINRGGFSSANGFGGPNSMYTYEIKPLNRTLQPEANDSEGEERISKGNDISGAELNAKDDVLHVGPVMNVVTSDDGSLMYYVILDPDTARQMKIDPTTARLVSKMDGVDPLGVRMSKEEEGLMNPGDKSVNAMETNESKIMKTKAKLVSESLNESMFGKKPPRLGKASNFIGKKIAQLAGLNDEEWEEFKKDSGMNLSQEEWEEFKKDSGIDKESRREFRKDQMQDIKDVIFAKRNARRHEQEIKNRENHVIELSHDLLSNESISNYVDELHANPYQGTPDMYLKGKFGKGRSYLRKTRVPDYNAMQRKRKLLIKAFKDELRQALSKEDRIYFAEIYQTLTKPSL